MNQSSFTRLRVFIGCCAFGAMVLLAACQTGSGAIGHIDDSWISAKIQAQLPTGTEAEPYVIAIHTEKGVVTLSGTVPLKSDIKRCGRVARKTEGVVRVVNNLQARAQ